MRRWLASKQTTSTTPIPAGAAIPVQNLSYGFDVRGDIRSLRNQVPATAATLLNGIIPTGPVSQAYSYDDFHRLTDATGQAQTLDALSAVQKDAYVQRFDYDDTHNLTTTTTLTSSPRLLGPVVTLNTGGTSGARQTQAYDYSGNPAVPSNVSPVPPPVSAPRDNPPHAPSRIGTQGYLYDANGNRLFGGPEVAGEVPVAATGHLWDEEQRLQLYNNNLTTGNGSYQYDHDGQRRTRRANTAVNEGFNGSDVLYINEWITIRVPHTLPPLNLPVIDESRNQYVWAGQTRITAKLQTPRINCNNNPPPLSPQLPETVLYYHADHLGGTQYLTDQCGQIAEHTEYLPFGTQWLDDKRDLTALNLPPDNQADDLKFTGKPFDPESGLYYFGARYYDPKGQVWISPDPILDEYMAGQPNDGVYSPLNLSLNAYGRMNPIRYVDPDGEAVWFAVPLLLGVYFGNIEPAVAPGEQDVGKKFEAVSVVPTDLATEAIADAIRENCGNIACSALATTTELGLNPIKAARDGAGAVAGMVGKKGEWKTPEEWAKHDHDALRDRLRKENEGFESGRHDEYSKSMAKELRRMANEADARGDLHEYGERMRKSADTYEKRAEGASHKGGRRK